MNPSRYLPFVLLALAFGPVTGAAGAAPKRKAPESDLAPIEARRAAVELANTLAKIGVPEPLAANEVPHPFNPPGFGTNSRPVAETAATTATAAGTPAKSFGDREILTALAAKVLPKGTLSMGSESLLIFGKKNLRAGDRLTVSYEGQDYNLELVSFDRTNFTLRLNKEEITRPIKPGKNP
jgi:hypothetical protein